MERAALIFQGFICKLEFQSSGFFLGCVSTWTRTYSLFKIISGIHLGLVVILLLSWFKCWLPFLAKRGRRNFGAVPFLKPIGCQDLCRGLGCTKGSRKQGRQSKVQNKIKFIPCFPSSFVCLVLWFIWKEFIPQLTKGMYAMFSTPTLSGCECLLSLYAWILERKGKM